MKKFKDIKVGEILKFYKYKNGKLYFNDKVVTEISEGIDDVFYGGYKFTVKVEEQYSKEITELKLNSNNIVGQDYNDEYTLFCFKEMAEVLWQGINMGEYIKQKEIKHRIDNFLENKIFNDI